MKALAATVLLVAISGLPACAQTAPQAAIAARIEEVRQSLSGEHAIGQVALSPDGKYLAWTEDGAIRLAPLDDLAKSRRVTAAATPIQSCVEDDLTWSPDSAALAFFSDCANPGQQTDLFLAPVDGGPPRRLTTLNGYVDSPAFSPDGMRIGFLYVEGATRPAGALAAMKPFAGVIGEDGIEVQRVAVARTDVPQPAAPALASPANLHVYEFDWSPDSQSLAYIAADPPGENNWWVAKLYTQKLDSAPAAILDPVTVAGPLHGLQIAVPRWSPDGKAIAFIGGLMSDQGVTGGDLYILPASGGKPRSYAEERVTVVWYHWNANRPVPGRPGDDSIDLTELRDGSVHRVPALDVSTGASGVTDAGEDSFDAMIGDGTLEFAQSVAHDGTSAFILSSYSSPPEIWIDQGGKSRQLTHLDRKSVV